jgi:hypothetical protein
MCPGGDARLAVPGHRRALVFMGAIRGWSGRPWASAAEREVARCRMHQLGIGDCTGWQSRGLSGGHWRGRSLSTELGSVFDAQTHTARSSVTRRYRLADPCIKTSGELAAYVNQLVLTGLCTGWRSPELWGQRCCEASPRCLRRRSHPLHARGPCARTTPGGPLSRVQAPDCPVDGAADCRGFSLGGRTNACMVAWARKAR